MRIESSVTSLSWIPSEAVRGMTKLPFQMGIAHYDEAPPDRLAAHAAEAEAALRVLRDADRFRFANVFGAWIEVENGRIADFGQNGSGIIGSTTMRFGARSATFEAVALPDLRSEPVVGDGWVRFAQSAGGRTGVPAPRRVARPPFVQMAAPLAWTSLELTLHADGRAESRLIGASPFPRHWVYDHAGALIAKTGLIDFTTWYRSAFGTHSPWGDEESPALVSQVETALEREWVNKVMRGAKPTIRTLKPGALLVEQGDTGDDLFLLLDGILRVEVDGEPLAELGPGAMLGERSGLEGGVRTSTLRAVTRCTVATTPPANVAPDARAALADGHRRENQRT